MKTWFLMHGYATYIWSAYGIVLGVLALHGVSAYRFGRRVRKQLFKEFCHASSSST